MAGTTGFDLDGVAVVRDGVAVLDGITVAIPDTGITVVCGPSGSGKSTLLRLLNRLDDATTGTVGWRGADLASLDPQGLRRRVAMVFQRPVVFSGSVLDNLRTVVPDLTEDQAVARLADVALGRDLLHRPAERLSGGEAQRLCLARALTTDPEVVLADEPTASLDAEARRHLEDLALGLRARVGWVWVTHDTTQIERLADHVIVVEAGHVLAVGGPAALTTHDDARVRQAVTGEPQ
ncbi:MAG: ABC transporter ATP-binding protein [Acidimicrobiales bacterium]